MCCIRPAVFVDSNNTIEEEGQRAGAWISRRAVGTPHHCAPSAILTDTRIQTMPQYRTLWSISHAFSSCQQYEWATVYATVTALSVRHSGFIPPACATTRHLYTGFRSATGIAGRWPEAWPHDRTPHVWDRGGSASGQRRHHPSGMWS